MGRVVILGATGRTGTAVLRALPADVHAVAALRDRSDVSRLPAVACDVEHAVVDPFEARGLRDVLDDDAVIVNAIRLREDIPAGALIDLHASLVAAGSALGRPPRIVTVGGAGALHMADGRRCWQSPGFPPQTLPRGRAHAALRDHLESSGRTADTTYLIPPPAYDPDGPATGRYTEWDPSPDETAFTTRSISYADFGVAVAAHAVGHGRPGTRLVAWG